MECPVKDGVLYVQHFKFGKVNGGYAVAGVVVGPMVCGFGGFCEYLFVFMEFGLCLK